MVEEAGLECLSDHDNLKIGGKGGDGAESGPYGHEEDTDYSRRKGDFNEGFSTVVLDDNVTNGCFTDQFLDRRYQLFAANRNSSW